MPDKNGTLLKVENLKTYFHTSEGTARAVDGVNYQVQRGTTLGMVGESGCGKSVSALSILRLIPSPPGKIEQGRILFEGENLLDYSERRMRKIRGNRISMIFQEPMTSLNPVFTVGSQIAEVYRVHRDMSRREAFDASVEMLKKVRIPNPENRAREYPHQMSGGMRQRVMIAMALACNPALLIADEPTTALDVTVQAQILTLMEELQEEFNASILLITHDLASARYLADRVLVLFRGRIVEGGPADAIVSSPAHPYTQALLASIADVGELTGDTDQVAPDTGEPGAAKEVDADLEEERTDGCPFAPRCPDAMDICWSTDPSYRMVGPSRVRCHLYPEQSVGGEELAGGKGVAASGGERAA